MIKFQLQHRYTTKEPDPAITSPALGKVPCRFAPFTLRPAHTFTVYPKAGLPHPGPRRC